MNGQQTSCVHRGNTFFGAVEIDRGGAEPMIRVRYNGSERQARLEGLPVNVIAHLLLRELVMQDFEHDLRDRRHSEAASAGNRRLLDL